MSLTQAGISWINYDPSTRQLSVTAPANSAQILSLRLSTVTEQVAFELSVVLPQAELPEAVEGNDADQAYWFTYDGNNRVLMDGGVMQDGQIQLVQSEVSGNKGQRIYYDAQGRQSVVIRSGGKIAETYLYNAQGNLEQISRGYFKTDPSQLFALAAHYNQTTIQQTQGSEWDTLTEHHYDTMGRVTKTTEFFPPMIPLAIYPPGQTPIYTPKGPNDEHEVNLPVVFEDFRVNLSKYAQKVKLMDYNGDGQMTHMAEYGYSEADITEKVLDEIKDGTLQGQMIADNSLPDGYYVKFAGEVDYCYAQNYRHNFSQIMYHKIWSDFDGITTFTS